MTNDEILRRLGDTDTARGFEPIRTGVTWHGRSISQETTTIVPTSPAAFTAKQVEDIGLAHEILEERLKTMDSPDATLTLRGPMSIEEIKAAVKQMRKQLLAEKASQSVG